MKPQSVQVIILLILLLLIAGVSNEIFSPTNRSTEKPPIEHPAAEQPPTPVIQNIGCVTTRSGNRVSAASFKNTSGRQLDQVDVLCVFKARNTKDATFNRYWASWAPDETKKVSLQDGELFLETISLSGTSTQGRLDSTWECGPKIPDKRGFNPQLEEAPDKQGRFEAWLASEGYIPDPLDTLITNQTDKVEGLQETLTAKYEQLQAKRSTLNGTGDIEQFNKDAAEYAKQLRDLRNEETFLMGLTCEFDPDSAFAPRDAGEWEGLNDKLTHQKKRHRRSLEAHITYQRERVERLEGILAAQRAQIEAKRSTLNGNGELEEFNKNVAEYTRRLEHVRKEEAFLDGLISAIRVR